MKKLAIILVFLFLLPIISTNAQTSASYVSTKQEVVENGKAYTLYNKVDLYLVLNKNDGMLYAHKTAFYITPLEMIDSNTYKYYAIDKTNTANGPAHITFKFTKDGETMYSIKIEWQNLRIIYY